jgi:opacity protein-like surface antigen
LAATLLQRAIGAARSATACGLVQFVPLPPQCVFTNPTVVTPFNFAASETRVGWTVGAGGEGHSGTNWPVKPEYDWISALAQSPANCQNSCASTSAAAATNPADVNGCCQR